jgi:hypothetical protein
MLLPAFLLCAAVSSAQQPATPPTADYSWSRVQALPVGASLHVSIKHHTHSCNYKASTPDTLECVYHSQDISYQRKDVLKVAIAHRIRSALVGTIPGIALAIGGAIDADHACNTSNNTFFCGLGGAAVSVLGGILIPVGIGVGAGADFTRATIYKAP